MMLGTPTLSPTLDADDIEPWITFLIERLGSYWPWLQEATPRQVQLLARALAAVLGQVVARHSLHTEIERDPAAIAVAVEEIVNSMKPERVQ